VARSSTRSSRSKRHKSQRERSAALDLVEERIEVGGRRISLLRPRVADALLDEEAFEHEEFLPYWAELWPSAIALAREVARLELGGLRVLELGCGLGLVSVAAATAGAEVLAADQSAEAIAFTTVNAGRNGVAVTTVRCAFERPEPLLAGAPWDLVLAADVLYEPKTVPVLVDLLPRLGRAVWLADPGRPREPDFLRAVDAAGWRRQSRVVTPEDAMPRVSIHRLSRPS
jgi:predicted nicotinamide N-methyase